MARKPKKKGASIPDIGPNPERIAALDREDAIAGIPGPGRWLVIEYQPTSLFSLKASQATSSVGVTLVIPTPYTIKMAFVDAAFRSQAGDDECEDFFRSLAGIAVQISPAAVSVITNTFIKIRQENRSQDPLRPYIPSIAYRELVYLHGSWRWAFDLASGDNRLAERLIRFAPHVGYVGKRGSFVQLVKLPYRLKELGPEFTQPIGDGTPWPVPQRSHVRQLDDFGPEATLRVLSSFTSDKPKREKHRRWIPTVIPVGIVNSGPGFSEYRAE